MSTGDKKRKELQRAAIKLRAGACAECPHKRKPAYVCMVPKKAGVIKPEHVRVRVNCAHIHNPMRPKSGLLSWRLCPVLSRKYSKEQLDHIRIAD